MKIRKMSKQKSVELNDLFYMPSEIMSMLRNHEIFYYTKDLEPTYSMCYDAGTLFRISTDKLDEIKVVHRQDEYLLLAVGKNEKEYHITL